MYILNKNKETFGLFEDGVEFATATCFWDKLPSIIDGKITDIKKKQIYITDFQSNQKGCGSILLDSIIKHFENTLSQKPKSGYDRKTLWLKVLIYNDRAFGLYKKFGFQLDTVHYDDVYVWMYKTLN